MTRRLALMACLAVPVACFAPACSDSDEIEPGTEVIAVSPDYHHVSIEGARGEGLIDAVPTGTKMRFVAAEPTPTRPDLVRVYILEGRLAGKSGITYRDRIRPID